MIVRTILSCFLAGVVVAALQQRLRAEDSLSARIEGAKDGDTIRVGKGTFNETIKATRSITLRGKSTDESVIVLTADEPALTVTENATVTVESMTIRWRLASSEPQPGPPSAVFVKDANLVLKNCRLIADGNGKRCPSGLMVDGFSEVALKNCRVDGFEFAVNVRGGGQGTVSDCVFLRPGHCGITVFSGSELTVERTIVAESAYHGLRSTGGKLTATDNLIINNRNRGMYLGNKSAEVDLSGNVIVGNGTGISGFAHSSGSIRRNVILGSEYAAVDARDTCALSIEANILSGNTRGFVLFAESGKNRVDLKSNTFWRNETDTENCDLPRDALLVDPRLADPTNGQFETGTTEVRAGGHGLENPAPIAKLWRKWTDLSREPSAD